MENLKILLLAITQGISELLPISSSGHLILLGRLMDLEVSTLLLTSLHIGTSLAIILFFRRTLFSHLFTKDKLLFYVKILVSVIPAAIIGLLYEEKIEQILRFTWVIAISLIFWGILMIIADYLEIEKKYKKIQDIPWKKALIIGVSQIIALIPGTSRSGISTLTGIALGVDKYRAFEYSLILGIPILLGSSFWEIWKALTIEPTYSVELLPIALLKIGIIIIVPFVVGYLSLVVLKKVRREKWLTVFGIYRIILGTIILLFL